jgi:TolB-like protein
MHGAHTDPAEWRRLETLYERASQLPPSRRAEYLLEECGEEEALRSQLDSLLSITPEAEHFFHRMASAVRDAVAADQLKQHPDPLIGTTFGRYRIEARIGAGGMGVVYRALDAQLQRTVALKLLPAEYCADEIARRRFLTEARAAAAIDHPNVCTIHETGETDSGQPFLIMVYCHGETLKDRIARGPLATADVLSYATQMARGLAAAHALRIVHRDVKPGNVMISEDGLLKLVDFGIARMPDATLTAPGQVRGTIAYVAPEQLRGEPIEGRADLWSLGVVMYEMVTGARPFRADTDSALLYAIVNDQPEPPAQLRPDVPVELSRIIDRLLQKDPAQRYASAQDVIADLERSGSPHASHAVPPPWQERPAGSGGRARSPLLRRPRLAIATVLVSVLLVLVVLWRRGSGDVERTRPVAPRVAVLFFEDETGSPDGRWMSTTLTTSLIGALASVQGLDIPSTNAVRPYRDRPLPLTTIADGLGVEWLIGGFVTRNGGRITATAELSDATGRRLDYRQVEGPAGEELPLIEQLVYSVSLMLRERMGRELRVRRWEAGTTNAQAFRLVQLAMQQVEDADSLAEGTDPGMALRMLYRADSTLARAAVADPDWPEPLIERAWLARKVAYFTFGITNDLDSVAAAFRRGIEHATAALEMGDDGARALEVRGVLRYGSLQLGAPADSLTRDRLLDDAEHDLSAAVEADTTLARALNVLSEIEYERGMLEQARLTTARAYRADAYLESEVILSRLFTITFEIGNDDEARRWCLEIARRFPNSWFIGQCSLMLMAWSPSESPDPDEAWQVAATATASAPDAVRTRTGALLEILVAGVLARAVPGDSAVRVLERVGARAATDPQLVRDEASRLARMQFEAGVRVLMGQHDIALELLREYLGAVPDDRIKLFQSRRFKPLLSDPRLGVSPEGAG